MSEPRAGRLRVGLLGAGDITTTHVTALRQVEGVEVAGVCDVDERRLRSFQDAYGVQRGYSSLEKMLLEEKPDVVHILLPAPLHAGAAETCLAAGCHLFVEKPFCTTLADCERVAAQAEQAGRHVGVNHNLTFMPTALRLVELIRERRLGAVEHVRVAYNHPISPKAPLLHWMFRGTNHFVFELGPHPLSVVYRLLGRVTAASSTASGGDTLSNGVRFYRAWQSSLICERGTAQCFLSAGAGYYAASVHVFGEDGEAFADLRRNTLRISEKNRYIRTVDIVDGWSNASGLLRQSWGNFLNYGLSAVGVRPTYSLQAVSVLGSLTAFYGALRDGRRPPVGTAAGAAVVEACERVVESGLRFAAEQGDGPSETKAQAPS